MSAITVVFIVYLIILVAGLIGAERGYFFKEAQNLDITEDHIIE
jgi:hypothetical protein